MKRLLTLTILSMAISACTAPTPESIRQEELESEATAAAEQYKREYIANGGMGETADTGVMSGDLVETDPMLDAEQTAEPQAPYAAEPVVMREDPTEYDTDEYGDVIIGEFIVVGKDIPSRQVYIRGIGDNADLQGVVYAVPECINAYRLRSTRPIKLPISNVSYYHDGLLHTRKQILTDHDTVCKYLLADNLITHDLTEEEIARYNHYKAKFGIKVSDSYKSNIGVASKYQAEAVAGRLAPVFFPEGIN